MQITRTQNLKFASLSESIAMSTSTLGRRKFMSVAGLADVLKEIREYGMPDRSNEHGMTNANVNATHLMEWWWSNLKLANGKMIKQQ